MAKLTEAEKVRRIKYFEYEAITKRVTIRFRRKQAREAKAIEILEKLEAQGKTPKEIFIDLLLNNYCN